MLFRLAVALCALIGVSEAKYDNCSFRFKPYEAVCKEAVKLGGTHLYINHFLISRRTEQNRRAAEQPDEAKGGTRSNNVSMAARIDAMVAHMERYREVYEEATRRYGVSPELIAAILMKESSLGTVRLSYDAFSVFNAVLHQPQPKTAREKRRHAMAVSNVAYILNYCETRKLEPQECHLPSSYAGTIGMTQFMPQSLQYVEAYGAGKGDLNTQEDAIVSVARYLHEVAGFSEPIDWAKIGDLRAIEAQWYSFTKKYKNASFANDKNRDGKARKCFTCNDASMSEVREAVQKMMHYNNSSHYAIGVLRLAYEAYKGLQKR